MTIVTQLLTDVLIAARAQGMDQKSVARYAGIAPETISRAKKRQTIEIETVSKLANVVGLTLTLTPTVQNEWTPASPVSPLADPKWGLAWSNPAISDEALVRNALARGGFLAILEGAAYYGMGFIRAQWSAMCKDDSQVTAKNRAYVEGMLRNIETGFSNAAT